MKKTAKILSIFLALVLTLTAFMIPAMAENAANVSARLELTPVVGEVDDNGLKSEDEGIYKLTMYTSSTKKLARVAIDVYFEPDVFMPLDSSMGFDFSYTTEYPSYPDVYFNRAGALADANQYDANGEVLSSGRPAYYGGANARSSDSVTVTHKYDNVICIAYMAGMNTRMPGNAQDEPLVEVYFKLQEGANPDGATFKFGTKRAPETIVPGMNCTKSFGYATDPVHGEFLIASTGTVNILPVSSIPCEDLTYTPAPAGPTVEKSKAELKFTLTSATTVADDYLFRVTSKISDADWDAYFANTGTSDATTNAIQKLGFVAYKGTDGFSMDTAKAVAQGTPAEGYYNATTDYVQKVDDTSDAYFGAIIDTSKDTDSDATYVAYVQYLDAEGQTAYAFYADAQTALLEQKYDTYVQQYVSEFGSGFAA